MATETAAEAMQIDNKPNRWGREYYACCDRYWEHWHGCKNHPEYKPCCTVTWCHHMFCPQLRAKLVFDALSRIEGITCEWGNSFHTVIYTSTRSQDGLYMKIAYPQELYGNYRRETDQVATEYFQISYATYDRRRDEYADLSPLPVFMVPIGGEKEPRNDPERILQAAAFDFILGLATADSPVVPSVPAELARLGVEYETYRQAEVVKIMAKRAAAAAAAAAPAAAAGAGEDDDEDEDEDEE